MREEKLACSVRELGDLGPGTLVPIPGCLQAHAQVYKALHAPGFPRPWGSQVSSLHCMALFLRDVGAVMGDLGAAPLPGVRRTPEPLLQR